MSNSVKGPNNNLKNNERLIALTSLSKFLNRNCIPIENKAIGLTVAANALKNSPISLATNKSPKNKAAIHAKNGGNVNRRLIIKLVFSLFVKKTDFVLAAKSTPKVDKVKNVI